MLKSILPKEEFNRNVLTLMTGTAIAQVIPLAITPILTRLYSPEQFGVFALFVVVTTTLSTLATGRYELAIMLPRKDTDAANITMLAIAINCIVSAVLFLIAWLFNDQISQVLGNRDISSWLYFVPAAIFLNGVYLSLNYWSNRKKLYTLMAQRRIVQSGGTAGMQLGLGLLQAGSSGLVVGSITGQALAVGITGKMVFDNAPELHKSINRRKMLAVAKRYDNCPKYLVPAHTLSAMSGQLPSLLMNTLFGLATSGFFMLAERVIGSPISLVAGAIGDVFRQQISQAFITRQNCKAEFEATFKKLVLLSTLPFIIFTLTAPYLFGLIFGDKWRVAGEYAQLMSPMFFMRFILGPLSNVAIIAQKNKYELYWQASLLVILAGAAWINHLVYADAKGFITLFTIIFCVLYLIDLIANYKFSCGHDIKN